MQLIRYLLSSWQGLAASVIVYFITIAVYHLYFHPLARFPGPRLAAITRLYEGYYDLIQNGQYTFKIADLHRKYGPIIRISPFELHVSDPSFFDRLYRQEGVYNKYAFAADAMGTPNATIFSVEHYTHKARRQPLAPFFSKAKVATQQTMIRQHVERVCSRLSELAARGQVFDLGAVATATARDVSNEYVLGKHYDSVGKEDFDVAMVIMGQGAGSMWRTSKYFCFLTPTLKAIPPQWLMKMADPVKAQFFRFLSAVMEDTRDIMRSSAASENKQHSTLIHEIMKSKLPDSDKSFTRIYDEVSTVLGAAFETTASTMRLIFFHLYSRPEILQRLREEIGSAKVEDSREVDLRTLEKLPYLTSVLMEGLRLSPGISTRMARIADRDLVYDKWIIPAGTPVGMTTILLHLDETMYPDPKAFNPDRWLEPDPWTIGSRVFAPFSKGSRICLGMHLAWAEMYIFVSALDQRFNFQFDGAEAQDFECDSDQLVVGTRGKGVLRARVTTHAFSG